MTHQDREIQWIVAGSDRQVVLFLGDLCESDSLSWSGFLRLVREHSLAPEGGGENG